MDTTETRNLAETLADVLPRPELLRSQLEIVDGLSVLHYAVPKGHEVKELRVDIEQYLAAPRALKDIECAGHVRAVILARHLN